MAQQSSGHVQTQQDLDPIETDLDVDQGKQDVGRGDDAGVYENAAGAQTGTNRSEHITNTMGETKHDTEPQEVAPQGKVMTRTPQSESQGITNHSASEESARQEKVVSQRPDALAAVNKA